MGKYFKYAIGEILLVVIGILIALQINNWNENIKDRETEKKILNELLIDLEISKKDLVNDLQINEESLKDAEKLKSHLYYKKPYYDGLESTFLSCGNTTQFTPRLSGYENLKSEGLNIVSNDSLRKQITQVFERQFQYALLEGREYDKIENPSNDMGPFYTKYFQLDMDTKFEHTYEISNYQLKTNFIKIKDYNKILNDEVLLSTLQKVVFHFANKINIYTITINRIDEISENIKKELQLF